MNDDGKECFRNGDVFLDIAADNVKEAIAVPCKSRGIEDCYNTNCVNT